jgi:hypothetical protein
MRITTIVLLALCCAAGCGKATSVDIEQQALRSALADYFSAQHWQGKPCYLKKNKFTIALEYPLAKGQPAAKVLDLAGLKLLANGGAFGPDWTIIRCLRETKDGKDVVNVELSTTQEKLDPASKLGAYARGKFYLYEIKGSTLSLIDSGEWLE